AAPVKVAISTTTSGFSSVAATSASANTRRPSASVFITSTVLPPRIVKTSEGLIPVPDGIFSAIASQPVTWISNPSSATACTTAPTVAAPVISDFLVSLDTSCLCDMKPRSQGIYFKSTQPHPYSVSDLLTNI